MQRLTIVLPAAVAAQAAIRWWLGSRQIRAVRAHRQRIPAAFVGQIDLLDQQRAADYTIARARIGRSLGIFDAALVLLATQGGGIAAAAAAFQRLAWPEPWRGTAVVLTVLLAIRLAALPFALWRTFGVEARFGFNRVSPRLFAVDACKQLALGLLLGAPLVLATLMLMQKAGEVWWISAWLLWAGATVALAWAAPRFIAPLFNRFSPLDDAPLERRVAALVERCGFTARGGVYVMDGSRRSAHGNAYFTGIGRNKRIVFFDTLIARLEPVEIEGVLAHELGHFRLHHVRQGLALSAAASCGGLALLAWLARRPEFYAALGVARPSPAAALLLFVVAAPVFLFFTTPLLSWWSRRHERAADEFAARHADARALAVALVKLYRDNASTLTPDRLHSAFYDSHPPAVERIRRLQALAAAGRTPAAQARAT
ncbi:MAG TPA: M48 family metallopeptidase [Steroidobacteraceae bacterium]|nr:M48 family metallopeptidase [Steroidobacteraceae bacterium]